MPAHPIAPADLSQHMQRWQAELRAQWGLHLPHPELRWDLRGRCAGQCVGTHLIRLNRRLPELGPQAQLETLAHEYAHAAVHQMRRAGPLPAFPRRERRDWLRPHGRLWQAVLSGLGHAPKRTHDFDLPAARQASRHAYHCGCQRHLLGPVRHRRAQRGEAEYRCRNCGGALRPDAD